MVHAEFHSLLKFEPDYFLQRFTSPPLAFQPGQFVMVKPSGSLDPFLPRAYSILRVQRLSNGRRAKRAHVVEILYKVLGKGTTALSQLKPGDRVDLLGPLGNGYHVPPDLTTVLLVAGGIGVPPVVALAERLASSRRRDGRRRTSDVGRRTSDVGHRRIVAFVGGKTSADALCLTDLRKAGATLHIATEDGSLGHRGLVTDLLEAHLASRAAGPPPTIYACGPHPMLHAVARIAERFQIPCQVSLEAEMACGFGACMGCVIPVHSSGFGDFGELSRAVQGSGQTMNYEPSTMNHFRYKLCCRDGPAFDAREIAW
ncbi:MAG: dihydroorotate dehydrogenase electron transfer subunit [Candidatus Methylomirabilales bacterium]